MAKDHRILDSAGNPLAFTCSNYAYRTNIQKGAPHAMGSATLGSVFQQPLISHQGGGLWLEHVLELATGEELYWLMWYDTKGKPTIPLSGVFDRADLEQMLARIAAFVP
jgi:hypothetical protein